MFSVAGDRPQRVLAKEHTMNVSAKLVNSLASMLTEEQFREFKRNVAIENCPGMTFASEWVASEDGDEFIKELAEQADDLGYVTSLDIAGIIENGFGNLFFSKYLDQAGNTCQVYGTKESIAEFSEGHTNGECKEFRRKNLDTSWNSKRFLDCVKTFIQYLVRLGVLTRTEYTKDTIRGGTARCYAINQNR